MLGFVITVAITIAITIITSPHVLVLTQPPFSLR